ncbi:MAG: hypothetical protein ACKO7W_05835 [Elainella sp.]
MSTQFLSLTLERKAAAELQRIILAELRRYGEPLRWAIVAIDPAANTVSVEAVVTTAGNLLPDIMSVTV